MQDDILDLTSPEAFGKQAGGDIVEGKRTWLMLEIARRVRQDNNASSEHIALITAFFANNGLNNEQVPRVIAMMQTYGVITDATSLVEKYTNGAYEHLNEVPQNPARDMLEALAKMLMKRDM